MCQSITMIVRTPAIQCMLAENPREREYNYSVKMIGHRRDFESEHSTNLKNPLLKLIEARDGIPENYSARDLEEGSRLRTRSYFSPVESNTGANKRLLSITDKNDEMAVLSSKVSHRHAQYVSEKNNEMAVLSSKVSRRHGQHANENNHEMAVLSSKVSFKNQQYIDKNNEMAVLGGKFSFRTSQNNGENSKMSQSGGLSDLRTFPSFRNHKKELIWNYEAADKDIPTMEVKTFMNIQYESTALYLR